VRGAVESLPPPNLAAARAVVANATDDFSDTQGKHNWYYGYFESGATPGDYAPTDFREFPNLVITDWEYQWSGTPQFLKITDSGQHPGLANGHQIWSIRRWVSKSSGTLRITGKFARGSNQGDGTGVRIYVDGKP